MDEPIKKRRRKSKSRASEDAGGNIDKDAKLAEVADAQQPNNSKAARQAAFRAMCVGLTSEEAVAKARLIPDAANFKVIRVSG